METLSVYADEELVERVDDYIWQLKQEGRIARDASRSQVLRIVLEEWASGNSTSTSGPRIAAN